MAILNLYGIVTIAPVANTIYDCSLNGGTNLEQTNEVYIYCDTNAGGTITLRLPSLNLFNGIWATKINVLDIGNNALGNPVVIECGKFSVESASLTANVATLVTAVPHGITAGQTITVAGIGAPYNGTKIASAVTTTTISFAEVNADIPTAPTPTGTVVPPSQPQKFSFATTSSAATATLAQNEGNLAFSPISNRFYQVQGL